MSSAMYEEMMNPEHEKEQKKNNKKRFVFCTNIRLIPPMIHTGDLSVYYTC